MPHRKESKLNNSVKFNARVNINFSRLIHEQITDDRRGREVVAAFNRITGRNECYAAFIARLQQNGHGSFPLNDFPAFCQALREIGIDPDPFSCLLTDACQIEPQINGEIVDEFVLAAEEVGRLAHIVRRGDLHSFSKPELRNIFQITGRMRNILRQIDAETANLLEE